MLAPRDAPGLLRRLAPAALLVAATAAAYSNALSPAFQLDDHASIVRNSLLRDPGVFLDPIATARAGGVSALARFVAYATFGLDRMIWGLDARGFHLTNVLVHVAAVLLVWALVRALFRAPRLAATELARSAGAIALLAALAFALHPVQTQAVTYVVQRMASLSTALGVAGLVAWLRFRTGEGRRRLAWLAAATVATGLAMLTKETAFTFPILAVLAEVLFFEGPLRRRAAGLAPLVATMAIVPAIVLAGPPVAERISAGGQAALGAALALGRREYLLTQAQVVASYLRLLAVPAGQNFFPDYPIARSLGPGVAAALALHLVLLGGACWLAWSGRRRSPARALVGFGVVWFYVALSVESVAVVLPDVYNEHRLYYASIGMSLAIATAAVATLRRVPAASRWRSAAPVLAAAALAILGAATFARNRVWADEATLWSDVAAKSPEFPVAWRMVGTALMREGRSGEAVAPLRRAVELNPFYAEGWKELARAYRASGDEVQSAHAMAAVRYLSFDFPGALALWESALRRAPALAPLHHGKSVALRALGRGAEADEEGRIACALGAARACTGGGRLPDP